MIAHRSSALVCIAIALQGLGPAWAQISWTYLNPDTTASSASGAIELSSGGFVMNLTTRGTEPFQLIPGLLQLSPDGDVVRQVLVDPDPDWKRLSYLIIEDTVNGGFDLLSRPLDANYNQLGWLHLKTDQDLNIIEQTTFFDDDPWQMGLTLTKAENGDLMILGRAARLSQPQATALMLQRLSPSGILQSIDMLPASDVFPRQFIETPDGYTVLFYSTSLGPLGYAKVLRFDNSLNYINGFALPDVNGVPWMPGQDSSLFVTGMYGLPHGGSIVAGYYHPFDANWTAGLMRMDSLGNLEETLFPADPSIRSESDQFFGLRALSDSTFLWVYFESDAGLEIADRFKICVVDTNLNILRTTVLETNYPEGVMVLTSVVPTSDGGLLVAGGYGPLYDASAYVAKINGSTGLVEQLLTPAVHLYPNPGSAFTVQCDAPSISGADFQLFDTHGRLARQTTLQTDRTVIDANDLATGLYHYRVLDRKGQLIANGKWMRE